MSEYLDRIKLFISFYFGWKMSGLCFKGESGTFPPQYEVDSSDDGVSVKPADEL